MKLAPGIYALRGLTAYEVQVWRFGMRFLRRAYWAGSLRGVLTFQWFGREYD